MEHHHLTRDLLAAVISGDLPPHEALAPVASHLLSLCPVCREEYLAFQRSLPPPTAKSPSDPSVLAAALEERATRLEDLHRRAERELRELRGLASAARSDRVRRALKRFSSPVLTDLLIEESQRKIQAGFPEEAAAFADLAVTVIGRVGVEEWGLSFVQGLLARALGHKSNALRVANDLRGAERELRRALSTVKETPDPMVRAEVSSLAASLRRDQRRFQESLQLLERAATIYRQGDEAHLLARTLVLKGAVLRESGDSDAAVETGLLALRMLSAETYPELYGASVHNIAHALVESGRCAEAQALLKEAPASIADPRNPISAIKFLWLRGRIARGLGRPEEAESLLMEAREAFLERQSGIDAALVALELALLYLDQGRREELRTLALAMWPILRSQDVHREAMASLVLFRDAIFEETLSKGLLRRLGSFLQAARRDRNLRFELDPPT